MIDDVIGGFGGEMEFDFVDWFVFLVLLMIIVDWMGIFEEDCVFFDDVVMVVVGVLWLMFLSGEEMVCCVKFGLDF